MWWRWWSRRPVVGTLIIATAFACSALVAVVSLTPWPGILLRDLALSRLHRDYGVVGTIREVDLDLPRLRASATGLRFAAADSAAEPFLTIDAVHVDLRWAALWGGRPSGTATLTRPAVSIARAADGSSNLPAAAAPPGGTGSLPSAADAGGGGGGRAAGDREREREREPGAPRRGPRRNEAASGGGLRLPFATLEIRDLTTTWRDDANGWRVDLAPTSLRLAADRGRLRGPLATRGQSVVARGGSETRVTRLDGDLGFDGSGLDVHRLTVAAAEGDVTVRGRIDAVLGGPQLDLDYAARFDLAQLAPHFSAATVATTAAGTLSVEGVARGPLDAVDALEASMTLTGDALVWQAARIDRVAATVRVAESELRVDALDLALAGGRASAEGRLDLEQRFGGQLAARWRDLDADRLLAAFGVGSPMALGTTAAGMLDARWDALDARAVELSASNRFGWDEASDGVRLEAVDGSWRIRVDERLAGAAHVAGEVAARFGEDWRQAPLAGAIRATCDDLARCRDVAAPWLRAAESWPLHGRATVVAELGGTLGRPRAAGTLGTPRLRIDPVGAADLVTRFTIDSTALTIEAARLGAGDNAITGRARLDWADLGVEGAATVSAGDLAALAPIVPAAWGPAGRGRLDATVRGTLGEVRAEATLALEAVELAGQRFDSATGGVRLEGHEIVVDAFRVDRDGGHLEAAGRYDRGDGTVAGTVTAESFPLTPLFPGSAGEIDAAARVSLHAEAGGTLDDPRATGDLTLADLTWADRRLGSVDARVRVAAHRLHAEARLPDLGASVAATVDIGGERRFAVTGALADADLARLLDGRGAVTGAITADATAAGTLADLGAAGVELRVARLAGAIGGVEVGLRRPAGFSYRAGDVRADDVEVTLGGTRLHLDGGLTASGDSALTARLTGSLADLGRIAAGDARADSPWREIDASGALAVELTGTGPPHAPDLAGSLRIERGSIALGDVPPVTDLTLDAAVHDGAVHFGTLHAVWAGATLDGSATLPIDFVAEALAAPLRAPNAGGRPARLHAELGPLTPAMLAPFVDADTIAPLAGAAAATLDLEWPSAAWESAHGRLALPEASFAVSGIPFAQRRPTEARLDRGRVTLTAFDWGNDRDYVTAGGVLDLRAAPAADFSLTGELDLRAVSAFAPAMGTAGVARVIADVSGTLDAPDVRGTVEIEDGQLRMTDPRLIVSDLNGAIFLTGDTLIVHELTGDANGGRLEVGGRWSFGGGREDGALSLTGEGMALDVPVGLRSEADLALQLAGGAGGAGGRMLSGTATIRRGEYREPLSLAGGLLALLERPPAGAGTGEADARSPAAPFGLDVRVTTDDDVVVDNNYLEAEVAGDLRIAGTVERPAVTGRVTVRDGGRVRFGNRVYEIDTGVVDLVDPAGIEPRLTLTARTRAGDYDITLEARGGADDLTTELTSDPPLPEADVVSVLVTGRTRERASAAPVAGAREQALGLVSNELLGQVSEGVGLDVRVGREAADSGGNIRFDSSLIATELNPGTRLTVGRDLSRQVRLIVSRDLRESDLAWIVDYLPRNDVELRAFFNDANERAYEFRHALSLGAPAVPSAVPAGAAAPSLRVSTVRFRGVPGLEAGRLRDRTTLEAGDRFDFRRWQRDRERIEAWYVGQGFREARVRARRERDREAGAVALDYEITPGPRTELVVTGHALPARVRHDLDRLWTRAVFDAFLVDALTARVTRQLLDEGYVRPRVDVEVARDDARNAKRITVHIDPGPSTGGRRLVYAGLPAGAEPDVRRFVAAQRLDRAAWTEPARLRDGVTAWYRDRGRLRAAVSVGEPRVAGRTAVLPVHIDRGPVFHLGAVVLAGFAAHPEAELREILALEPGAVFTADALRAATARVEARYRSDGYTTADVSAEADVDEAQATVALRIAIRKGPRQVIAAVTVEGAPRTDPGLVADALRLREGTPVDPAAWTRARRRLYDTGVFRSVDLQARVREADASAGAVPVEARVVLEEWPAYRVRYGLRVADDLAPLGQSGRRRLQIGAAGDVTRRNLFGRGLTAGAASRVDLEQQAARVFLTIPRLLGRAIETNLFAGRRREVTGAGTTGFVTHTTALTVEQRFRPSDRVTLSYSANLDETQAADTRARIARVDASALLDTRDSPFDATTGVFLASNLEYGVEPERALRFVKYRVQHFAYRAWGPLELASAVRVGLATAFGGELLPFERFFAGGGNTVRGYAQDSLGPADRSGAPAGGHALLILNQEIRAPIARRVRGVGFVDAGNVFESVRAFTLRGLKTSAGVGLRIESPIGVVRLDYGLALQRAANEPRGRFFFSLGQAF